jgi:hypothetical protein
VAFHLGEAVGRGLPLPAAAKRAKIGRSTLHRWVAAARAGYPEFTPLLMLVEPASASRFPW